MVLPCIVALHLGIFYWMGTALMDTQDGRSKAAQRREIEIKFSIIAPHAEHPVFQPRSSAHVVRQGNRAPAVMPPASMSQTEAAAAPPVAPAGSPSLDLDRLGREAVALTLADMKANPEPRNTLREPENAIGNAISQASRPKCDNDYKPVVAGVRLEGLMKIPSLVGSALTDKGCKW